MRIWERFRRMALWKRLAIGTLVVVAGVFLAAHANFQPEKRAAEHERPAATDRSHKKERAQKLRDQERALTESAGNAPEERRGVAVERAYWEGNESFPYPVVQMEDEDVETAINGEIEEATRWFYERGQYFQRYRHKNDRFSLDYAVGLNDGKRLSIALHRRWHYAGMVYEYMEPVGMTFDLATGRLYSLEDYDELAEQEGRPEAYEEEALMQRRRQVHNARPEYIYDRAADRFFIGANGHVAYLLEVLGHIYHDMEQGALIEKREDEARTFYLDLDAPMETAR